MEGGGHLQCCKGGGGGREFRVLGFGIGFNVYAIFGKVYGVGFIIRFIIRIVSVIQFERLGLEFKIVEKGRDRGRALAA